MYSFSAVCMWKNKMKITCEIAGNRKKKHKIICFYIIKNTITIKKVIIGWCLFKKKTGYEYYSQYKYTYNNIFTVSDEFARNGIWCS